MKTRTISKPKKGQRTAVAIRMYDRGRVWEAPVARSRDDSAKWVLPGGEVVTYAQARAWARRRGMSVLTDEREAVR